MGETSLPKQDYMARVLGYGVACATVIVGAIIGYFEQYVLIAAAVCIIYPHLVFFLSRPFRFRRSYTTRQFLIHGDAILCGLFLAYIDLPVELSVLFLISGAAGGVLIFGYDKPDPVPQEKNGNKKTHQ